MASRHEIVTIDFRANAAKANPAMESLRLTAKDMRTEIEKTEAAIANGKATGMAQAELEKLGITLKAQKKELSSFETAINSLSKGVGALGRAIDAFNAGTLSQMSAAFQKTSYNAAENAKKLLSPNDKDYQKNMAELDALQQKNLENLAKYKLRTEQMLQSIGEGGKISTSDLKQEADGIQELMRLLPHMGQEWMEYYNILQRVNEAVKVQTENEKRLSGAIVDANDARIRAAQLTKQGNEEAARQRKEAAEEIALRDKNIAKLKDEQKVKQEQVADSAALVQAKDKEIVKQKKIIAGIQERIDNEEKDEKTGRKQIETLNKQADAWVETAKKNKEAVETMKGEVGGLKEQLEGVNAELEKMGTVPTQPAASPAAASTTPATAAKNEERQAVEQKNEADKKEEQSIKNKTKAEKDETQAVRENTDAKKDEVKVDEQVQEAEKKELKTKDEILKRQDELKVELDALYKEKADYAKQQEKNTAAAKKEAEAVKEEANAYKDLSKEQAEAMLKQKEHPRTTITKGEDGSFSFANAEEAQHFILDSISKIGGYQNGKYSLTSKDKVNQLLAQFGERYGVSGDDTVGAMRGVLKAGGYTSGGVMNPFIGRLEPEVTASYAAYAKEMKDLTAVIEGNTEAKKENTKATDESVKAKRTEAEIDKDIAEKEAESRKLTIQLRKANDGVIESIEEETEKTETLSKAQKKRIDLLKQMLETYKDMSKEEAKAEYTSLTAKSTVGYKGGKLDMSNPEEVQSWLIGQARLISGKKGSGAITLEKGQVDKLLESFSKRYGWTSDSSKAKDLLKQIIQGDTGLFKSGGFANFSGGNLSVTLKQDNDAIEKRITKLQALTAISEGAAEGIEKMTGATKGDTDATKIWANEVERRYNAYMDLQKKVEEMDAAIQVKRKRKSNLPKEGADAQLMRRKIDDDIEDYKKQEGYDYTKNQAAALKKSWEGSVKTLSAMMGLPAVEEVKQDTAATDQNTASVERNTQARGRKKKATEEAAAAQQQETKAGEEAVKQEEKLSAEDQKRQELLKRKTELEGKIAEKESEIAQKTEDAAGLEQKANNNRDEATRKINELAGAHKKNADDMADESRKLYKLEGEQDGYTKTLDGYRAELAEINKQLDDNAEKRTKAQQKEAQSQKLTIDAMNDAIKAMEAENRTIEPQSAKWNENIRVIQQYKAEIERLKNQPVLQMMTERMGNLGKLSTDALAETKKFWQAMADGAEHGSQKLAQAEAHVRTLAEEERQRRMEIQKPMRENLNNLGRLSTADLTETKRYWETMRDGAEQGTAAYKKAELAVKALSNEEKRRKDNAQAQYINDQMRELNNLSVSGLIEVRRYWEAMAAGAKRGSDEAKDAANALRQINNVEVRTLFGDLSKKNTDEIRAGIEAGKRLISTYESGSPAAERLSKAIVDAEEHLKNYGIEAERNARREAAAIEEATKRRKEQDLLMRQQLDQGTSLSESALKTQQQYWQRLIDDPKTAKESLAGYRYELERTMELQEKQTTTTRNERASKLGGNLSEMSEGEIREAIEAGKQLIQTYKSASPEAETLAKNIVAAEEHVKQYGVEAQRAAVREAKAVEEANRKRQETNQLMEDQLRRGTGLTESALKQQEQYWQRLADDPKAAASEIAYYIEQLNKVKDIQKQQADAQVKVGGISVLQNMRGDVDYESKISENQRKEDLAALKAYRDTLPKENNLSLLQEIDYYMKQLGASAKEAGQDIMSVNDALILAGKAGTDAFAATPQEIQMATKAIEKQRDAIIQTIKVKRDSGAATDAEEKELAELTKKLRDLKFEQDNFNMSQAKMQELMRTPTNAVSLDELRAAIKRADGELKRMEGSLGQNNAQYKAFAEQVRNAKNQLKEMEGQAKASATAWEKAWSRLKTYVVMYMGFNAVWQKMTGTADDLMQLSDKMGEVRKTTGFTADEVGRLSDELKKLDTRTTITGLLDLSVAAGQLGLKTQEDVEGFTIAANKLMVALPEMGKEGATEMLKVALATGEIDKIRRQMEQGLIDGSSATAVAMEKVGSTIDRLRATSAATAPAITDFVKRVGAVGAQSGISIDQVAALGSTVDALGMRVEMSATALSRMIPAIKNNAFDVAKAIGVTPNTLRELFETGRGMEAILMIFQKIKDSGMGADDIDKMLGMGNMKEVMKELNQQGARAGIVFAGLSQNVDTLREHLNTASKAYEENIAIQQEYDKMNETTAARWERLKNVVEELFVGDASQRWLGGIIDGLRSALDVVVELIDYVKAFVYSFAAWKLGVGGAIWAYLINPLRLAITETHSLDTQIKRVAATWRTAWRSMDAATKANLIMAIGTAVYYLGKAVWDTCTKVSELAKAMAEVDEQEVVAIRDINHLSGSLTDAIPKANGLAYRHKYLKEETDALRKEVDELKKSTDKSAEAHGKLSKKTEELEKKEKDLKAAEDESNKANKERSSLITEINSKYGTYLGYMLNEETAAMQVAQAHRQIVAALKEEMEQKRMNRQQEAINAKYDEKIAGYQTDAQDELSNLPVDIQRRIMNRFNSVLANITFEIDPKTQKGIFRRNAAEGFGEKVYREREGVDNASYASFELMQPILKELIKQEAIGQQGVTLTTKELDKYVKDAWGLIGVDAGFWQLSLNSLEKERQTMELRNQSDNTQKALHATSVAEANKMNADAYQRITSGLAGNQELTAANIKDLAQQVNIITGNLNKYKDELKDADKFIGKDNDATLENAVNTMFAALSEKQRKQILNAAKRPSKVGTDTGGGAGGGGGTNPWGGNAPAESTDYATWDVNELVARRNQMDKFKNVLKPDTDIRAVLAEDKALMKALDNGLKEDWKSVLGWYNTERKKIQEELKSERFSTNEGHWRDEKQGRSRKNHFRESDYALAELDRYYSKRKEELEKARIEENMSEELFNRQAELLEQEHLERRSKLRETFTAGNTKAEKEMVKQFREWWSKLEKDGKLDEVPWATVESEWAKALASEIGRNNLKAQQDLTQMQQITVKHLNKIADIIAKERPYDGIVDNLRKNLTDMDILFVDMEKKGATDPATLVKEQNTRLQFLLGEAETAYQSSIDEVLKRMADAGMTAWAEEISKSDAMKNALMAQLQKAYDEIQNAIKKEASQIKKQTDIWWNDLMPGQDTSRKGGFEMILSRLGLQEDQVKRANALIGAGAASERVADKLAIKQMQIRLQMQQVYYQKMRQMWDDRIRSLREQGKEIDAQHAEISKQLSLSEEQKKLDEQRVAIANQLEESQNRLYRELKEWGDLLASSVREVMEASNAGNAEYYNELAKLNLTGKGGPGAGTYIVIEDEGTEDAEAHYEYLTEREALERQHEIEVQNAQAEAWRKLMDDMNAKMNDQITDWINAMVQNQAIDANTAALRLNTEALKQMSERTAESAEAITKNTSVTAKAGSTPAAPSAPQVITQTSEQKDRPHGTIIFEPLSKGEVLSNDTPDGTPMNPLSVSVVNAEGETLGVNEVNGVPVEPVQQPTIAGGGTTSITTDQTIGGEQSVMFQDGVTPGVSWQLTDEQMALEQEQLEQRVRTQLEGVEKVRTAQEASFRKSAKTESETDKQMMKSSSGAFAKMTAAANMYGIAYQAMSNDNLSATQKFEMIAIQAAGNAAMTALTVDMAKATGETTAKMPGILGQCIEAAGPYAGPVLFAVLSGLLGGLLGLAASKIASSKSQISQATGASSASAGKLTTGMLAYAEGNVDEFTDPKSLTPGRMYNVDAADGRTYRAKYTGTNPKTHLTNGPEFHLSGEKGREMIIDAGTTRQITMNENEIWHTIKTLSGGGRMTDTRRRTVGHGGMRAFAEGNVEDFEEMSTGETGAYGEGSGFTPEMLAGFQQSLERNNDLLERALNEGIKGVFGVYGQDGLVHTYDTAKKTLNRHGEKY